MCIECIRVSFTACVLVPSCKITQLTRYHMEISNHPELMYTCAAHDAAGTHSPSCVEGNNPFSLPLPRFHASAATLRRPTARAAAVTSSSRHVIVASRHRRSHLPPPLPPFRAALPPRGACRRSASTTADQVMTTDGANARTARRSCRSHPAPMRRRACRTDGTRRGV